MIESMALCYHRKSWSDPLRKEIKTYLWKKEKSKIKATCNLRPAWPFALYWETLRWV